jgi:aryl-alcohol dehydrogenase-like predicted oxidoreductase
MRKLGESGLFVSEMCFGAMTFGGTDDIWGQVGKLGQEDADALVKAAVDEGINLFDTADVYANGRSEEILGQSLRNLGVARDDLVIATKVASAMEKVAGRRNWTSRPSIAVVASRSSTC